MNEINVIVLDDEPLAVDVLKNYISKTDNLNLLASFNSPIEAHDFIQSNNNIDLIFIDIQMPDLNGFELLDTLKSEHNVIFTTAFSEYALKAYKYNVIDYLLKPIGYSDFLSAVSKYSKLNERVIESIDDDYIFVNNNGKYEKLELKDLLYLKANGDFIDLHTIDKRYFIREQIGNVIHKLPSRKFIRTHRSYVINIDHIDNYQKNEIQISNRLIPLSKSYKEEFDRIIESKKLG